MKSNVRLKKKIPIGILKMFFLFFREEFNLCGTFLGKNVVYLSRYSELIKNDLDGQLVDRREETETNNNMAVFLSLHFVTFDNCDFSLIYSPKTVILICLGMQFKSEANAIAKCNFTSCLYLMRDLRDQKVTQATS